MLDSGTLAGNMVSAMQIGVGPGIMDRITAPENITCRWMRSLFLGAELSTFYGIRINGVFSQYFNKVPDGAKNKTGKNKNDERD